MSVRIAILVDNKPLFASGIIQQALFTYKCLANTPGHSVFFVSTDPTYLTFGQETGFFQDIPVMTLTQSNLEMVLDGVSIFLCLSSNINTDRPTLERIKNQGTKIVQNICGNNFIIDQERFVFGCHEGINFYENSELYDEYWLLPMYSFAKSYIETMTRRPVIVVPYVWDADIIEAWMKRTNPLSDIHWRPFGSDIINPTILIAEPNVSIHKTALVPLAICERYFLEGGKLEKILCLSTNKADASDHQRLQMMSQLTITRMHKVETYPRMILPDVLHQLLNLGKSPIIISHQIMNDLNFLHLEMFYLGHPIIHNCERLKDAGFYYEACNVEQGAKLLADLTSSTTKIDHNPIQIRSKEILWRYSSRNPENIHAYAARILHTLHS
jgi:hypothetical protein